MGAVSSKDRDRDVISLTNKDRTVLSVKNSSRIQHSATTQLTFDEKKLSSRERALALISPLAGHHSRKGAPCPGAESVDARAGRRKQEKRQESKKKGKKKK